MTTEATTTITDTVEAQLVECAVDPRPLRLLPPEISDDATPTDQARAASISQVGAEPPPLR